MPDLSQMGLLFDADPAEEFARPAAVVPVEEKAEVAAVVEVPPEEITTKEQLEEAGQISLLEIGNAYDEHWEGMPEFCQKDKTPWFSLPIHFRSREDLDAFSKLVGQKINLTSKSIWYPPLEIVGVVGKRFVDAS